MSAFEDWNGIQLRIDGFLESFEFVFRYPIAGQIKFTEVVQHRLYPMCKSIHGEIEVFLERYRQTLSAETRNSLISLIEDTRNYIKHQDERSDGHNTMHFAGFMSSVKSDIGGRILDLESRAVPAITRSFLHLNRSIVADDQVRDTWKKCFDQGEVKCENLGALHLLSQGIYAVKASGEGERTDLILSHIDDDDLTAMRSSTIAMVLTEWKIVNFNDTVEKKIDSAIAQLERYHSSLLGGFELAGVCYVVLISQKRIAHFSDRKTITGKTVRIVSITTDPDVPSREALNV